MKDFAGHNLTSCVEVLQPMAKKGAVMMQDSRHCAGVGAAWLLALLLLGGGGSRAVSAPVVTALNPNNGLPSSLVVIDGTQLEGARVIWDAGLPTQRALPSGTSAQMFTVPAAATSGAHPVRLEAASGASATFSFTVEGPPLSIKPRIDDISLTDAVFIGGQVRATLYVQGANLDVGASVLVDGVPVQSTAHKALLTNLYGVSPKYLGYPVRHYLSRIVPLPPRPPGSVVRIVVRNEGGESSAGRDYRLPGSATTLDSDGDGLTDVEETIRFDNGLGAGAVDLRSFGVDPYRKDVLVEMDLMEGLRFSPLSVPPGQPNAFEVARSVFANAPLLNPYGPSGINLYFDLSGTAPRADIITLNGRHSPATGRVSLRRVRETAFTIARRGAFHYAVWAAFIENSRSGYSNVPFIGDKNYGDSFMIGLGDAPAEFQTVRSQAETIIHELGHDLGQRHGGIDHYQYSPSYLSAMAYTWQLRSSRPVDFRRAAPTCTAFYYGGSDVDDLGDTLPSVDRVVIDYSQGMARTLTFGNTTLSEKDGVCGTPVDWNRDQQISDGAVDATPFEPTGTPPPWTFADFANWSSLNFDGPKNPVWTIP